MATTIAAIRAGLATRLRTITPPLNVYPYLREALSVPCCVIGPASIDPNHTAGSREPFGGGLWRYEMAVWVLVARTDDENAQRALDAYLASTGTRSVYQAIVGDNSLGGAAASVDVLEIVDYDTLEVGGISYLGCRVRCRVIG